MTSTPTLNYDILLEVLKACPRPDCARFMQTGRFFYTHGVEALLSDTVRLYTDERLRCFLSYLSTSEGTRYQFVRSLEFGLWDISEEAAQALILALLLLSNLNRLSISCDPEGSLLSYPGVSDAFAMLTTVRDLSISCAEEHAVGMLQSLRSELVSANINFSSNGEDAFFDVVPEHDWPLYHPVVVLQNSVSTLETLTSYRWFTHPSTGPDPTLVYPRMREVYHERALLPLTVSYTRAYPNLAHLELTESELGSDWRPDIQHCTLRRHLNIAQQVGSGCTWRELGKFRGILADLYVLGLTCSIRDVELHDLPDLVLFMLEPVLSDARPRRLKLRQWPMIRDVSDTDIFAVFRGQGGSRLELLDMDIEIGSGSGAQMAANVDVAAVLDDLLFSLLGAPLQDLQLDTWVTNLDPRPNTHSKNEQVPRRWSRLPTPPPLNPDDYPLLPAERSADTFDLEDYMRRFAREIPTMQRGQITMIGPRDSWRRITLTNGQVHFEERFVRRRRMVSSGDYSEAVYRSSSPSEDGDR